MATRLPNLALAAQLWDVDELIHDSLGGDWEDLIAGDVDRWYLAVSTANALGGYITTKPISLLPSGFWIPPNSYIELEYNKHGPRVGQPWSIFVPGHVGPITYFYSSIRKTQVVDARKDD